MSTLRANLAQLYTPIYDKFMLAAYSEEAMVHPKVFDVITDPTKEWKYDDVSTLGMWVDADEGASGGYDDPVLGYPKTLTPAKVWKKFKVSFEAVDQDEYALVKQISTAENMGRGIRARMEYDTAGHLYNAFSTAGADGQYDIDSDHPKNRTETGTTYSNLLSGAFSHDNLETAETAIANNFKDMAGIPIMPSENPIILYPPALRGSVQRVLAERAGEQPDTTMRNINRFAGKYTPIEWRYLSADMGGSDTAWYIIFKELGLLKVVMNSKPHFTSWVDEDLEYYMFKGRVLYDYGICNWRGLFGSTGL
jgi:hypothetical protein